MPKPSNQTEPDNRLKQLETQVSTLQEQVNQQRETLQIICQFLETAGTAFYVGSKEVSLFGNPTSNVMTCYSEPPILRLPLPTELPTKASVLQNLSASQVKIEPKNDLDEQTGGGEADYGNEAHPTKKARFN